MAIKSTVIYGRRNSRYNKKIKDNIEYGKRI